MDVRISDAPVFYEKVKSSVHDALHQLEMIPKVVLEPDTAPVIPVPSSVPEPFESRRIASVPVQSEAISRIYEKSRPLYVQEPENIPVVRDSAAETFSPVNEPEVSRSFTEPQKTSTEEPQPKPPVIPKGEQMELFDDRLLSAKAKEQYDILGQLFETYWLIQYQDKLLIIDQHAAHEKVKYERFMKRFYAHNIISQAINPPMIVTLTGREEACYRAHREDFEALGFEIEEFGVSDFAIRGVPLDLYGYREEDFFREVLDELVAENVTGTPESIRIRIATMACKAAVKGNMRLTTTEAKELIDELLTLDNPYNCPHGRPTIISMSKYELEKKFKRIVT